jgi:hypothetical protein
VKRSRMRWHNFGAECLQVLALSARNFGEGKVQCMEVTRVGKIVQPSLRWNAIYPRQLIDNPAKYPTHVAVAPANRYRNDVGCSWDHADMAGSARKLEARLGSTGSERAKLEI